MIMDAKAFVDRICEQAESISLMEQEKKMWELENMLK